MFRDEAILQNDEISGYLKSVEKKLDKIGKSMGDYVSLISGTVFADIMKHFKEERGPDGPWVHWSYYYTIQMAKKGKLNNKILQDTGRLRQSFTPQNWKKKSDSILFYNPAKTKTGFPYAFAHDNDEEPRGTGRHLLPRRSFMWLSDAAINKIGDITVKWLAED